MVKLPEENLLLACAGVGEAARSISNLQTAAGLVTNWDRLIQLAQHHRLMPLAYTALSRCSAGTVPAAALDRLRGLFVANTIRNTFLVRELDRTLALFEVNHVRALPFKGPLLAFALHGDCNLRQVDDLDFLIHPDDLVRAKALLMSAGYRPYPLLSPAQEKAYTRLGASHCLGSPDGRYFIDLETQIAPRQFSFNMPAELLWRSEEVIMDGRPYRTLSAETLMLILCVHGTKHLWKRLAWTADIAALLRKRTDIDFGALIGTATTCGGLRMLLTGLAIARELSEEPLPAQLAAALEHDPGASRLARRVMDGTLGESATPPSLRETLAFHIAVRERWRDRARSAMLNLFVPTYSDWQTVTLPAPLFPLYYATRPFRLLGRIVRGKKPTEDTPLGGRP